MNLELLADVGVVRDVVNEITRGGDVQVGDGSVLAHEATLIVVELEQIIHPGVFLKNSNSFVKTKMTLS